LSRERVTISKHHAYHSRVQDVMDFRASIQFELAMFVLTRPLLVQQN